ncbi:MAG TPA: BTAD domain-containing putative transcriptional regulator [Longimicrobiaceae bacterium]|nr:BTAD domain-containing putative transcriptional regulator [Longimicrobiaceae bacterium]
MTFSLKLFGGASLTGQSGAVGSPATQRHRLALLALLATSHPRALPRERLMVRLWPERDNEHTRKLLNQAVHALRKTLGEEAILSAGEELRFNPRVVQCDVIAFEEALATGDAERAVELYAGPFLDGFFLSQAPEFERWAEGERERFRRACCKALEGLAEGATARDDSSSAVEWWRRLAAEEPYNARLTLRLMKALEAGGDRAGALQQARVHTLLLQEEFEAVPDPQVTALADRLRTEPAVRIEPDRERPGEEGNGAADPQPVALPLRLDSIAVPSASASVTEADKHAAVATEPRSRAGIPTPMPRWNFGPRFRWVALALPAFGGLAVLLTASLLRRTGSPTLHPQRLVVAPFENRTGDPALDPVGSMAADWITHGLSRTAIVDVVTRHAALVSANRVRAAASETPDLDPIRALSEETGAGLVISGAYYLNGDSLHFQAQITDARHSTTLWAVEPVAAGVSAPMPAIELLRQRTLAALAPVLDTRLSLSEQKYPHPGQLMLWVADELRVHGHTDAARKLYTRAIGWYRARPAEEQERYRAQIGHAHRLAEEWREAQALFEQLAAEEPENIAYQGALGVLAARRGDRVEAERIAAWLAARREPYLSGNHSYWRACIAVQLGRKAEAVTLLREAFGQGMWYTSQASWPWLHLHTDPCLDPLRDYRPFRELMRPKG